MNWQSLLNNFDRNLLDAMGYSYIPTDHNPISKALKSPDFVTKYVNIKGFNRGSVTRLAVICQMVIFDVAGGPEGDRKPKGLRRHWYSYYKGSIAQPFAMQMGDYVISQGKTSKDYTVNSQGIKTIDDRLWNGRMIGAYGDLVNTKEVTYRDLWVEDASRMMHRHQETLFRNCHIIVAVEKDSLFQDFVSPAAALGARTVYSGKGKSSKAGIEKLLREHFGWNEEWNSEMFTEEDPLIVLHISDYDFDGEAVIGPTFAQQARRYTPYILEARVGIQPKDVNTKGYAWDEKWYRIKVSNEGYKRWSREKALFLAECDACGHQFPVVGELDSNWPHLCPQCGYAVQPDLEDGDSAHGFEVEALQTRDYRALLVDALLQVLPFDLIIAKLREECTADARNAANEIQTGILEENESYRKLLEEFDRLEEIKREFGERIATDYKSWESPTHKTGKMTATIRFLKISRDTLRARTVDGHSPGGPFNNKSEPPN